MGEAFGLDGGLIWSADGSTGQEEEGGHASTDAWQLGDRPVA